VPTITTLVRIADALECKVTKLVELLDQELRTTTKSRRA
jgi:hypothetical protein